MKKIILLLMLATATTVCAEVLGTWNVFPSYYTSTKNKVAGDIVYSLSDNSLMSYNTKDSEVRLYNSLNGLSSPQVAFIDYNSKTKKLIVVYKDNNIDLIDNNGNITNLPDLKDKVLVGKEINDVYIHDSIAYLGTGFGVVEVDMDECVFRNSYRISMAAKCLAVNDKEIFITSGDYIYRCGREKDMHVKDNWNRINSATAITEMIWHNDKLYTICHGHVNNFGAKGNDFKIIGRGPITYMSVINDQLMWSNDSTIFSLSADGTINSIKQDNTWNDISYDNGTYWVSDMKNGLRGYKLVDDKYEITTPSIQPNSPKNDLSYHLKWVGERLLVTGGVNTTDTSIKNEPTAMMYEDGTWTNFEELTDPDPEQYPRLRLTNTTDIIQDPDDDTHHFASLHRNGICEYRNGKFVKLWNCSNTPLESILPAHRDSLNYVSCSGITYDKDKNIWMLQSMRNTIIRVWKNDGKWAELYYPEIDASSLCDNFVMMRNGLVAMNCRWMPDNNGHRGIFFLDTNGTLDNTRDDHHKLHSAIINQDETTYQPDYFYCMAEDVDGRLWVGTDLGLFVVDDMENLFSDKFRFTQVKINRNDGSGLADYLLSGVSISCITVDGANRKWIGTNASGVFLISADGQEMVHNFTEDNSPLLSNSVQDIAVCPVTGEVMIATEKGLCSFMGDATEAAEELDEDNITCFPNPVGSDYTGPIIVRGLTMDSEVKIVSTGGQLIWSGRSLGGEFTWNGCNKNGRRVASGVYHVIANNAEGKKAVVTRIVIVK